MRSPRVLPALLLMLAPACGGSRTAGDTLPTAPRSFERLDLVPLGGRVFAAVRKEPLALAGNSNSLIVVRDSDVVVVDAQFTQEATLETIGAIRTLTRKPVGYLISTHWHDDHAAGIQSYRDSFPGVRYIVHANTKADFDSIGIPNRATTVTAAPPMADRFDRLLAMELGLDSTPVSPAERTSLTHALRIMRRYLAEAPALRVVPPDDTVSRRMTLGAGEDRVDILWFGRANTRGDLVVHVPARGVVAAGDLVVHPVPFGFNSYPGEWIAVLDSIRALGPAVLLPGHGPVMRDLGYVDTVRTMLATIRDQARATVARGDSLRHARQSITLDDYRRAIAGDEKWMNYMFRSFFLAPVVQQAYREARRTERTY